MGEDTKETVKHWTLFTAAVGGIAVFLWKIAETLHEMQAWQPLDPHTAGDVMMAFVFGLVAMLALLGLNLREVLERFGISIGGKS